MAEVRDGTLKISLQVGNKSLLDETVYTITEYAREIQEGGIDIPASSSDANYELTNRGFEGVLIFYDPNNTGELSIKFGSASNDSHEINPICVISGSDVDGLTDIYITNDDTTNANELRIYGMVDAST